MDDAEVVAAFVAHLADEGHPGLTVDARPDLDNRDSSDIDAIAGGMSRPLLKFGGGSGDILRDVLR